MEWKSGEEGKEHARKFAEELAVLMKKYDAEFYVNLETVGYNGCATEPCFSFNCCSYDVELGDWSDGTDLEVK